MALLGACDVILNGDQDSHLGFYSELEFIKIQGGNEIFYRKEVKTRIFYLKKKGLIT